MRIIELKKCSFYTLEYRGKRYEFKKNVAQEVSSDLADKLLSTGDFMDVIVEDDAYQVGSIVKEEELLTCDLDDEVTVPLDSLDFNKLEMPTMKKEKRKSRKKDYDVTD